MLGAIVGDVVGSVYEYHNTKDYDFKLLCPESTFTDDTIMSIAVASWLLKDPSLTHAALEREMVHLADLYPKPYGSYGGTFIYWLFRPGMLAAGSDGKRHPYGSWGNGSAMRVSAVGWFFETLEETERAAEISASITHDHPEGIKGAQATAACIWMARNGKSKEEIRDYVESRFGYDLHRTWEKLHLVYRWEDSCQKTVPEAIVAFLDSTDFEDSLRKAVSLGGDSDTLACINAGIAEAFYGGVPKDIADRVTQLLPKEFIEVVDGIYARKSTI